MKINNNNIFPVQEKNLEKISIVFSIIYILWSVLILFLLVQNIYSIKSATLEIARTFGRESFRKDLLYRRWNSMLGSVYGEICETNSPNPYLITDEKNIITPHGLKLTKINPAYMTRQVHELGLLDSNIVGHITSLNPIRPQNKADDWEVSALKKFESGQSEVAEITKTESHNVFRYMAPLYVEKSCLNCHGRQGYQTGQVRGGISISYSIALFDSYRKAATLRTFFSFSAIWLIGGLGLLYGHSRTMKLVKKYNDLSNRIISNEKQYRTLFENMVSGCMVLSSKGSDFIIKAINRQALSIENMDNQDLVGKSVKVIINEQVDKDLLISMEMVDSSGDDLTIPEIYFDNGHVAGWRKYQFFKLKTGELVVVYMDVSEEYKKEMNLNILKQAVEQSTSLIGITDKNGNLSYVNSTFLATTEYTWDELVGKNTRILKSGEQPHEFYKNLWKTITDGETWSGEFHNKTKSGKLYWEAANISPIFDK
ncbi:MAG: DUF3365 domain-containing protein [Candidatus Marinimicrobia bacterium]|nr:DUF3365 domain-containing protein [Candidatus Neomarinimicrobiota bacterium]